MAAALLLAAVGAGAPAACSSTPRATSSIVWVVESVGTVQKDREIRRFDGLRPTGAVPGNVPDRSFFSPAGLFEAPLFQRPPPSHPRVHF
jgi:hypothetical protein